MEYTVLNLNIIVHIFYIVTSLVVTTLNVLLAFIISKSKQWSVNLLNLQIAHPFSFHSFPFSSCPFSVSSLHLFIFSCIQLSSFKSPNSPLNLSKESTTAFSAQSSPTTMVESKKKRYQVKKRKEKQKRKKRIQSRYPPQQQ